MAPAGTSKEILSRLSVECARAVQLPDIRERLAALGAEPVGSTPDQLVATMRTESARWAKVVKAANIRAD